MITRHRIQRVYFHPFNHKQGKKMATVRQFGRKGEANIRLAHIYWILLFWLRSCVKFGIETKKIGASLERERAVKLGELATTILAAAISTIKIGSKSFKLFWWSAQNIGVGTLGRRWQAAAENYKWQLTRCGKCRICDVETVNGPEDWLVEGGLGMRISGRDTVYVVQNAQDATH